jgi:hypothetical protein
MASRMRAIRKFTAQSLLALGGFLLATLLYVLFSGGISLKEKEDRGGNC